MAPNTPYGEYVLHIHTKFKRFNEDDSQATIGLSEKVIFRVIANVVRFDFDLNHGYKFVSGTPKSYELPTISDGVNTLASVTINASVPTVASYLSITETPTGKRELTYDGDVGLFNSVGIEIGLTISLTDSKGNVSNYESIIYAYAYDS